MNDLQLLSHLLDMAGLETTPAREISHSLLDAHHDLEQVLALSQEELLGYPDLGESAATFLLLLSALMERYTYTTTIPPTPLDGEEDIRKLLAPHFTGQDFERACAFLLGDTMQPFTSVLVGQGGRAAVTFSIRRVVELVLNHRARGVILAHNHPDGNPNFSQSDLVSTSILAQELALIDVPLLDHYLVVDERIISLRSVMAELPITSFPTPLPQFWFPQS